MVTVKAWLEKELKRASEAPREPVPEPLEIVPAVEKMEEEGPHQTAIAMFFEFTSCVKEHVLGTAAIPIEDRIGLPVDLPRLDQFSDQPPPNIKVKKEAEDTFNTPSSKQSGLSKKCRASSPPAGAPASAQHSKKRKETTEDKRPATFPRSHKTFQVFESSPSKNSSTQALAKPLLSFKLPPLPLRISPIPEIALGNPSPPIITPTEELRQAPALHLDRLSSPGSPTPARGSTETLQKGKRDAKGKGKATAEDYARWEEEAVAEAEDEEHPVESAEIGSIQEIVQDLMKLFVAKLQDEGVFNVETSAKSAEKGVAKEATPMDHAVVKDAIVKEAVMENVQEEGTSGQILDDQAADGHGAQSSAVEEQGVDQDTVADWETVVDWDSESDERQAQKDMPMTEEVNKDAEVFVELPQTGATLEEIVSDSQGGYNTRSKAANAGGKPSSSASQALDDDKRSQPGKADEDKSDSEVSKALSNTLDDEGSSLGDQSDDERSISKKKTGKRRGASTRGKRSSGSQKAQAEDKNASSQEESVSRKKTNTSSTAPAPAPDKRSSSSQQALAEDDSSIDSQGGEGKKGKKGKGGRNQQFGWARELVQELHLKGGLACKVCKLLGKDCTIADPNSFQERCNPCSTYNKMQPTCHHLLFLKSTRIRTWAKAYLEMKRKNKLEASCIAFGMLDVLGNADFDKVPFQRYMAEVSQEVRKKYCSSQFWSNDNTSSSSNPSTSSYPSTSALPSTSTPSSIPQTPQKRRKLNIAKLKSLYNDAVCTVPPQEFKDAVENKMGDFAEKYCLHTSTGTATPSSCAQALEDTKDILIDNLWRFLGFNGGSFTGVFGVNSSQSAF